MGPMDNESVDDRNSLDLHSLEHCIHKACCVEGGGGKGVSCS